ncbi:hypothetical protein [Streptomyces sp. NPDC048266]|uniref:hypothetical protein n=1 Tax=Streptomyces sp. NPDC048266 TaxID=3155787 RepID=UPI0033E36E16
MSRSSLEHIVERGEDVSEGCAHVLYRKSEPGIDDTRPVSRPEVRERGTVDDRVGESGAQLGHGPEAEVLLEDVVWVTAVRQSQDVLFVPTEKLGVVVVAVSRGHGPVER